MGDSTATSLLAGFASSLKFEDIPSDVIHHAKLVLLDSLGCAIAASTLGDACRELLSAFEDNQDGRCSLFGTKMHVTPERAAFINGALVHALNFDATGDEIGHQGVVALAAPFAISELCRLNGRELLTASVVACELSARITAAIARTGRHPSEKFLAGQLLSYIPAAAGAARCLGLDSGKMESALGLALMQTGGSRQVVLAGDPPAKSLYGAFPNQAGVASALLAQSGVDARCDIFGPPAGLYSMIYGGNYLPDVLTSGLGSDFLMLQADIKPWPCSLKVHPFVEQALSISGMVSDVEQIDSIEISATESFRSWLEPEALRRHPPNASVAANSIQFCVAVALTNGTVTAAHFSSDRVQDAHIQSLAGLVRVTYGSSDDAKICIRLRNGHVIEREISQKKGKHYLDDPRTVKRKFRECLAFAKVPISPKEEDELILRLENLEQVDDVSCLFGIQSS